MTDEDQPMLIALPAAVGGLTAGVLLIRHQARWPSRLLRQIRALPEHRAINRQEKP
jgi:hypothetical protein